MSSSHFNRLIKIVLFKTHVELLSKVFSDTNVSCNCLIASSKSACSLSLSGDSVLFKQIKLEQVEDVFCNDLSEIEIDIQPIVTTQVKLQKTAYPFLLQRRNRIDLGCFNFVDSILSFVRMSRPQYRAIRW